MPNFWGLGLLFQIKDQATAGLQKIGSSLSDLEYAATKAAIAFKTLSVGKAMFQGSVDFLKGAFDMTDDARKFELTMAQLRVHTGASVSEMESLRAAAIDSGLTGMHGPIEMAEAMDILATAGYNARDAMTTARDALRLLTASGGEMKNVSEAANVISMIQTGWGVSSQEAIDKISEVSRLGKTKFGEMQTMVSHVMRGLGDTMGTDIDQVFALVGLVRNMAGNMESAATMSGVLMERMQKTGNTKFLESLGVKFRDANGAFRGPLDIMWDIYSNQKFQNLANKTDVLFKAFGSRQGAAINALFKQFEQGRADEEGIVHKGRDLVDWMIKGIHDASKDGGAAKAFEDAVKGSFDGVMKMIDARMQTLRILVGEGILRALKPLIVGALQIGEAIESILTAIPAEARTVMAQIALAGGVVVALTTGLGLLIFTLTTFGSIIGGVVAALSAPMLIAAAIVGALTAAIGLVGVGLYAAFKNNIGGITDSVGGFVDKVMLGFKVMKQLIETGNTYGDVHEAIMKGENAGLRDFLMGIWYYMNVIKKFGEELWDGFVEGLKATKEPLYGLMGALEGLLSMFGITLGSAADMEAGFKNWGEAGRALGHLLADLANAGIATLAIAIEMLVETIKIAKGIMSDWGWGGKYGGKQIALGAQKTSAYLSGDFKKGMALGEEQDYWTFREGWEKENKENGLTIVDFINRIDKYRYTNPALYKRLSSEGMFFGADRAAETNPAVAAVAANTDASPGTAQGVGVASVSFNPVNNMRLQIGDENIWEGVLRNNESAQNRSYNVPFGYGLANQGNF